MTWSGVCLRAIVFVIPPVSIVGHEYSHKSLDYFPGTQPVFLRNTHIYILTFVVLQCLVTNDPK